MTRIKAFFSAVWSFIVGVFTSTARFNRVMRELMDALKPNRNKSLFWDSSRRGTYRRKTPKLGRNAVCPCGAMRVAPHDTSLPQKIKWCSCKNARSAR